jgi:hypothetical protein
VLTEIKDLQLEKVALTKSGKPRKRKPKKKNVYFTQETEDAIVAYVSEQDQIKRDRIYSEKIHYAFYKLAENIIHTFKFYYTEVDDIEDLKYEVISFLIQKLQLFNHSKFVNDKFSKIIIKEHNEHYDSGSFITFTNNSSRVSKEQIEEFLSDLQVSDECKVKLNEIDPPKAYSYFGTIAKRYLIIYNNKNYKKLRSQYYIDDSNEEDDVFNSLAESTPERGVNRENLFESFVQKIDSEMLDVFATAEEIKIADAILTIFKKKEKIDIFNKKAFFIYVKEMTDANSNSITKVIKTMKKTYFSMLDDRLENYDD